LPRRPGVEALEGRQLLSTFMVTDTSDDASDAGSLRHAITQSNLAGPGPNTIDFNIPGTGPFTIAPATLLPTITVPVTIDGYSQSGASPNTLAQGDNAVLQINLDGSKLSIDQSGLTISAGNSTVRGLVISGFRIFVPATVVTGGIVLEGKGGDVVAGNFLGTNVAGTAATTAVNGIGLFEFGSTNDTVGGTSPADRNLISGNAGVGVDIDANSTGTLIEGNFIGTDATGTTALPNGSDGIISQASNTTVGGAASGAGNLISGNNAVGFFNEGGSTTGIVVQGNLIGTDVTGTKGLGNGNFGVAISGSNSTVGGTDPGARNVISVDVGGLNISGNNNVVQGNLFGTDITGKVSLQLESNAPTDVFINGGNSNTIGGTTAAARNVMVGTGANLAAGVGITINSGTGNVVEGNFIGTDITGNAALGNGGGGVAISTSGNTVGGSAPGAGNVISGNGNAASVGLGFGEGIIDLTAASSTLIEGNLIGVGADGTTALGNSDVGVLLDGSSSTTLGNTIAFNSIDGVRVSGTMDLISRNSIFSNNALSKGINLVANGNNLQPAPVLTFTPNPGGGNGTLSGTLAAAASSMFTVEIFSNDTFPTPGDEEGKTFITSTTVSTNASGMGSFSLPEPTAIYTATATDPNNNTSEFSNAVGAAPLQTTTTTLSSSLNPSTVGTAVTFTAVVAPASGTGTPGGNVTFSIDGAVQTPSVSLSVVAGHDEAVLPPVSNLAAGPHTIAATYNGDTTFAMSVATPLTQTVNKINTTTTLSSSLNPSTVGTAVTFTAIVAPASGIGTPGGNVTFSIDGTVQTPSVPLAVVGGHDEASLPPVSNLSAGPHTIAAIYNGDTTFATSTATPLTQTVNTASLQNTTTTLSSSLNPSTVGTAVTFTAVVAPASGTGTPGGNVTFSIDGTVQTPSVSLSVVGGHDEAVLPPVSNLAAGPHAIAAMYNGDTTFATSVATPLTQTVNKINTTTTLSSSLNPSTVGAAVTFTAIVAPTSGTAMPGGDVTFAVDGVEQNAVPLQVVSGQDEASLPSITNLAAESGRDNR
jgi:hypothetical protein